MPNRVALVVHYLACIKAGLVATPLNYRYQAPEIDHALEVTEASILFAHAERDADLAKSRLAGQAAAGSDRLRCQRRTQPQLRAVSQSRAAGSRAARAGALRAGRSSSSRPAARANPKA